MQDGNGLAAGACTSSAATPRANGLMQAAAPWPRLAVARACRPRRRAPRRAGDGPGKRQGALAAGRRPARRRRSRLQRLHDRRQGLELRLAQRRLRRTRRATSSASAGAAVVALVALVVLAAFGVARRGYFKGDLFVAAAVVGCGCLLAALHRCFPVLKALGSAFLDEDGRVRARGPVGAPGHRPHLRPGLPGGRRALRRGLEHAVPGPADRRQHHLARAR